MPDTKGYRAANALAMAQAILGEGVRIIGASFSGNDEASGIETGGSVTLSTGQGLAGQKTTPTATTYIDIDFIPEAPVLALGLTLTAEELPEDAARVLMKNGVSVWVNGSPVGMASPASGARTAQSRVPLPVQSAPPDGGISIGMLARLGVTPGQANTIRIATAALGVAAIVSTLSVGRADAMGNGLAVGNPGTGNNGNDGTQGNAGGSGNGNGGGNGGGGNGGGGNGGGGGGGGGGGSGMQANDDFVEITQNTTATVDLLANDDGPGQSGIFITQINGVDVEPGDTVTLVTGEQITLNADGTVTITTDGDIGQTTFEYTAAYGNGNANQSDTAIVTINTVPCFVAGTMIRTDRGDVPVERLQVGQLVMTRDDGPQPIRWIGRRTLPALGRMAPVRINRGTFGDHRTVMVSPLHRVLIRNVHAELLFGDSEVLIAAQDLIDGRDVMQIEGGWVQYVHILFDRHQVLWSEGLQSESFLPGPQTTHCFEQETVNEICQIFPELDPTTGAGYGPAARPALRSYEARVLVA